MGWCEKFLRSTDWVEPTVLGKSSGYCSCSVVGESERSSKRLLFLGADGSFGGNGHCCVFLASCVLAKIRKKVISQLFVWLKVLGCRKKRGYSIENRVNISELGHRKKGEW